MKNFAILGVAGYVAPRHLNAIRHVGGKLVAALDPHDSVGILDSHFPNVHFFTEFERFDRHVDKLFRSGDQDSISYMSICSPNYLHDAHLRFTLRSGADAICEKPLVLNPRNLDALGALELDTGCRINTILQLRLHPSVQALKAKIDSGGNETKYDVELSYVTSRGRWYLHSWKGNEDKSGGIATNIGVHFFDLLAHLFGAVQESRVHLRTPQRAAGFLEYDRARVRWFLSIDENDLPETAKRNALKTFRSITVDGDEVEFSEGFNDLHDKSYAEVLAGRGFGVEENRTAIETVSAIRTMQLSPVEGDYHPFVYRG